jgi:Tfp pilus assembly protein PilX
MIVKLFLLIVIAIVVFAAYRGYTASKRRT